MAKIFRLIKDNVSYPLSLLAMCLTLTHIYLSRVNVPEDENIFSFLVDKIGNVGPLKLAASLFLQCCHPLSSFPSIPPNFPFRNEAITCLLGDSFRCSNIFCFNNNYRF